MDADRLDKLLANSARKSPAGIAVIHPHTGSVTYAQLHALAGQITEALQSVGVASNDRVGICLPKSIGSVASIFASLRSDACHVPVDPGAPAQRSAFIFADCGVKAILVHRPLLEELRTQLTGQGATVANCIDVPTQDYAGVDLVLLHVVHEQTQSLEFEHKLAYILYTSGSTGKPKGVMHSHATALAFVDWCSEEFKPTCDDRFSSHAPFHFDLSIFDLYVSIKHQATLVLIGEDSSDRGQARYGDGDGRSVGRL
jgi:non-ribosomal peptide synthetase component F